MDETYVKVAGRLVYLYRAVDQFGQVIDVYASTRRDSQAPSRFFHRATIATGVAPVEVITDRAPTYPRVVEQTWPEGTGSYGVGLARWLRRAGVHVIEVNRPDRAARRCRGTTDAVDAEAAARAVLDRRATVTPKNADGPVQTLRLFKLATDSAVKARTQAINQLKAVLVGAEPELRESLAGLGRATLIRRCAQLPDPRPHRRCDRHRRIHPAAARLPRSAPDRRDQRPHWTYHRRR